MFCIFRVLARPSSPSRETLRALAVLSTPVTWLIGGLARIDRTPAGREATRMSPPLSSPVTGPVFLLVNPVAGGGRARGVLDRACAALRALGPLEVVASEGPRDESRVATMASRAGARVLVVLGGDGAVSHAARGLIAERSLTPLAVFAAGTGNDFAKSLGTPSHDYEAMAALIAAGGMRIK